MKNANDQNFFNFVEEGLRKRIIRYILVIYKNKFFWHINKIFASSVHTNYLFRY